MHATLLHNLRQQLRFFLDRRGLSQRKLSVMSGLDRSAVYHIFHDDRLPKLASLYRISQSLGVTVDRLLSPLADPEDLRLEAELRRLRGPGNTAR